MSKYTRMPRKEAVMIRMEKELYVVNFAVLVRPEVFPIG
jgi:hypothetical protein